MGYTPYRKTQFGSGPGGLVGITRLQPALAAIFASADRLGRENATKYKTIRFRIGIHMKNARAPEKPSL